MSGNMPTCPVCASNRTRRAAGPNEATDFDAADLRITDHRYGMTLPLWRCERCSFLFADPAMAAALEAHYMLLDGQHCVIDRILQQKDLSHDEADQVVGTILAKGFGGWMVENSRGDIIHDTKQDPRWFILPNQPYDVRSVIGMPLRRRQRIVGILTLVHDEPHHFKEENLPLLNAIAGQAAIALENASLFNQTEQERSKLSAIINSTQGGVMVITPNNQVSLLNPAAQGMIGVNAG